MKENNTKNQTEYSSTISAAPPDWWALPKEKMLESLQVDPENGLSTKQIQEHRTIFGANVLKELKPTSIWRLVLEGIRQPVMVLLLSIAAISFIFREFIEGAVMIFVVAAYISVEFINKFRADRTMARLRELTQPTTRVIREGKEQEIPTTEVVICDLIILSAGVRVAADARLIESSGLLVNEASLTGESQPVRKEARAKVARRPKLRRFG